MAAGRLSSKTSARNGRNVVFQQSKARFEVASGPKAAGGGAKFEIASNTGGQGFASVQGGNGLKFTATPDRYDTIRKAVTPDGSLNIGKQGSSNARYEVATPLSGDNKLANPNQVAK